MTLEAIAAVTAWWTCVAALLATLWACARQCRAIGAVPWPELGLLAAVVVAAVGLRSQLPAYLRIYTDESYYMLVGSEMRNHGGWVGAVGYGKSYGWPALVGLSFVLGPRDPATAVFASLLCGALTLVLVYAAGAAWDGRDGRRSGLAAAVFLAASPVHALYSNTAEANVGGVFTLALLLLAAGLWRRARSRLHAALVVTAAALCCATRPEGLVLAAVLAASALRRDRAQAALVAAGVALAVPNLMTYAALHIGENVDRIAAFGVSAARWSIWEVFFKGTLQQVILAFAALGVVVGARSAPQRTAVLLAWLLLTLGLLSAAGTGALAAPDRFVLAPDLPAALLAGFGAHAAFASLAARRAWVAWAAAAFVIFRLEGAASRSLDPERSVNPGYALQHRLPELLEESFAPGCALVANRPEMYRATTDLRVLSAPEVLSGAVALPACARFIWDITCAEWRAPPFEGQCAAFRERAAAAPLAVFSPPVPPSQGDQDQRSRDALLLDLTPSASPGR